MISWGGGNGMCVCVWGGGGKHTTNNYSFNNITNNEHS